MQKKLKRMKEIEARNTARIKAFACKPRKVASQPRREKPMGNWPGTGKPEG